MSLRPPGTPAHYVTETPQGHLLTMSLDLPARCLHTPHGCAVTLQAGTVTVARMGAESRGLGPKGWGCPSSEPGRLVETHLPTGATLTSMSPHHDSCSESRHRRAPGSVSPSSRDGSRENHRCPGGHPARGMGPLPAARPASGINLASPGSPPRDTRVSPGTFQSAPYYTYELLKQEG